MRVSELIKDKVIKNIPVVFIKTTLENGDIVMGMEDLRKDKRYIINASINDFKRFEKWEGIRANVDLQRTGTFSFDENNKKLENMRIKTKFGNKEGENND